MLRHHGTIIVVLLSVFLLELAQGQAANGGICNGQVGNTKYSLQGLSSATGGTDITTQDQGGNTYYYRPCQVLQQVSCQTPTDSTPAACQKDTRKMPQYHDCGSTTQVSWSPRGAGEATGFFIQFQGGEDGRKLDVEFICTPGGGIGQLKAATPTEQPEHFYHLQWATQYACSGGDGDGDGGGGDGDDGPAISGGWIFIIILLSLLFIYFVAGVAYNKFRKDAHGLELIPNHEFWFALPGLVWAGNVYTYRKLRGLCGASYESV